MEPTQTPIGGPDHHGKSPNFLLVVVLACVAILVVLIAAYFILHKDGTKMIPHGPNPAPNSLAVPAPLQRPTTPINV